MLNNALKLLIRILVHMLLLRVFRRFLKYYNNIGKENENNIDQPGSSGENIIEDSKNPEQVKSKRFRRYIPNYLAKLTGGSETLSEVVDAILEPFGKRLPKWLSDGLIDFTISYFLQDLLNNKFPLTLANSMTALRDVNADKITKLGKQVALDPEVFEELRQIRIKLNPLNLDALDYELQKSILQQNCDNNLKFTFSSAKSQSVPYNDKFTDISEGIDNIIEQLSSLNGRKLSRMVLCLIAFLFLLYTLDLNMFRFATDHLIQLAKKGKIPKRLLKLIIRRLNRTGIPVPSRLMNILE